MVEVDSDLALDHDIEPLDRVTAGQQRAARVGRQVARLLLGRPREEVERAVELHSEQRCQVRTALRPYRHHPVDLRLLEAPQRVGPARRRIRVPIALVELGRRLTSSHPCLLLLPLVSDRLLENALLAARSSASPRASAR